MAGGGNARRNSVLGDADSPPVLFSHFEFYKKHPAASVLRSRVFVFEIQCEL